MRVRHEACVDELVQRWPALAGLQQGWPLRWAGKRLNHHLQVVFLGKSGHGKSTLVNALTGLSCMATSDVAACTREAQSVEYRLGSGQYLSLVDLPGLGESQQRDQEYLPLYRDILDEAAVVVYLLRADQRDHAIDLQAFDSLFQRPSLRRKVVIALSASDKVEPLQRHPASEPSAAQLHTLIARRHQVRQLFPKVRQIIPLSAATGWNLDQLGEAIYDHLQSNLWLLGGRAIRPVGFGGG